eukprot:9486298-Pyramimonas_sp.AAC.1
MATTTTTTTTTTSSPWLDTAQETGASGPREGVWGPILSGNLDIGGRNWAFQCPGNRPEAFSNHKAAGGECVVLLELRGHDILHSPTPHQFCLLQGGGEGGGGEEEEKEEQQQHQQEQELSLIHI